MPLTFKQSKEYSLGVELELQLLDKESLALVPKSGQIIAGFDDSPPFVKPELMLSNVEVNTRPCSSIEAVQEDLLTKLDLVYREALRYDTTLSLAGTHPFSSWKEQGFVPDERYTRLLDKLGAVARRFNIFGLHVHVGIDCGEKCIFIMNSLLYYLPHLLALSANSPFWNGEDTGLKSYRSKVFEALPTAGVPAYFDGWSDYSSLVDMYISTGTIETIREIWWDVRPHPDFGTLEIRVCDAPCSIKQLISIVALIQALVARLGRAFDEGVKLDLAPYFILKENKWRAARYGLDASFILPDGSGTIAFKDAVTELYSYVYDEAMKMGSEDHLAGIKDILKYGNGASRQLHIWKENCNLKSVVKSLSDGFIDEIGAHVKSGESNR
ncbi:MAG: YbdK family carboxylate-amine ligase [bacterium]|nr:YbdK family carboxylate-amine ligase [bacterium]